MTIMHDGVQISHPAWCRSGHHEPGEVATDPVHLGPAEPFLLSADDWEVAVRLLRQDEVTTARGHRVGVAGIELGLTSYSLAMDSDGEQLLQARPFLALDDARALVEQLVGAIAAAEDAA